MNRLQETGKKWVDEWKQDGMSVVVGGHSFQREKFMLDKKPSLEFLD